MRALLLLAFIMVGCGPAQHSYAPAKTPGDEKATVELTSFAALSKNIFEKKCVGCHSGSAPEGDLDLSSYDKILGNKGVVVLGQPDASSLYKEVKSGDMPMHGQPLSAGEVQAIGEWIAAGAPDGDFGAATVPPTFKEVQTKLFDAYCVKCHSGTKPAKKIDLSNYASLMAKKDLVVPGQSNNSVVYLIIKAGKMPPKGVVIPADALDLLKAWIDAGASNN